jgi:AcrR family transcriptional regulator
MARTSKQAAKRPAARKPRRGRPPRLSRSQIVAASAEFLRDNPNATLTLSSAASAAGATPMAIYRYVKDRDDLLTAVLEHVLGELSHEIPIDADWQQQVRAWMTSVHDHLLQFPQCLPMISTKGGASPAWLRSLATLAEILERAGFFGARQFEALFWISTTTMGYVQTVLGQSPRVQAQGLESGLKQLSDDEAVALRKVVRHAYRMRGRTFTVFIERAIAGVEGLLAH